MTNEKLSLQDIILTLQQYWAKQGANLMQGI
jgi:glycyl-tRNA synthetase alpha chain